MIEGRLAQLVGVVETRLCKGDAGFRGLAIDSRRVAPGQLFVALRGERHDGHDFVAQAAAAGAAALLVERECAADLPQLVCADTQEALGDAARWWRRQCPARVVGLTGSNGKTTVKTLTAAILGRAGRCHANLGNLNNEIGLPLSLAALPADADFAVLEMGAGKPGDIAYLAGIAEPEIALVNNVGPAHLERLGSLDGVAETKGAIYDALPAQGIAVVNADDAYAGRFLARIGHRRVLRFGFAADTEITARDLEIAETSRFVLRTPAGEVAVRLPLSGRHNVANALAAAALAHAAGAHLVAIRDGLEGASAVAGRLDRRPMPGGWTLIDDSYNANPGSVRAAIDTLALEAGERWLVLGTMAELGPDALTLHAEVGRHARAAGIDRLWTVGAAAAAAAADAFGSGACHFATHAEAADALRPGLRAGVTVLVKGSRSAAMERVVAALAGVAHGGAHHAA